MNAYFGDVTHNPKPEPIEPILCHDCYPNPQGGVVVCPYHLQRDELAEWRPRIVKLVPSTLVADPTPAPMGVRARVYPHGYRADPCGEDAMGREQAQRAIDG